MVKSSEDKNLGTNPEANTEANLETNELGVTNENIESVKESPSIMPLPDPRGVFTVTQTELQKFIDDAISRQIGKMKSESAIGSQTDNVIYKESEIDVADVLTPPAVFFCFSSHFTIWGDVRNGQKISTPFGRKLTFERYYRYSRPSGSGKGNETISVSRCVLYSKKEANFIRSHTVFGVKVFEDTKSIGRVDTTLAEKMTEVGYVLGKMNDAQIISRAEAEGITIDTPDVRVIKRRLMQKMAETELMSQRRKFVQVAEVTHANKRDKEPVNVY